ncbi:MAG: DNA polymerase I [Acidimicrobiia bacterium]|jgi:DNA polymerase-1|nr:DNA polymerase I [Acidimicrobiia bacterium]MDQ3391702.1 DNA polymerase I [Actinomycetota bacterium]
MATLVLIDGNSLTYRAFFALPTDMSTASGQVTNAVFGFTSMFINMVKEQQPDGVLVAFDRPEPTFRHDADPEYKAQRQAAPDILRQQMGLVRELLVALGVASIDLAGWEADDLLATVAERAVEAGHQVIIVTGDRDAYQLVRDPGVRVLYNRRGVSDYVMYDEAGIAEKTGVTPAQYPEYASLRGDPSDNLPGVPGVGEKTAAKLINTYGGLDGIFEHLDEQTPKLRASLSEHEERVRRNRGVMVLRRDAPIEVDLDELAIRPEPSEVKRLFDFLEFRTLSDRLAEALEGTADIIATSDREVLEPEITDSESPSASAELLVGRAELDMAPGWGGTEPGRSPLTGIAVVTDGSSAGVTWIPVDHLDDAAVAKGLTTSGIRGHNVKALMRALLAQGIDLTGLRLDTAIAAYLVDPAEARYNLPELVERFTAYCMPQDDPTTTGQLDLNGSAVEDRTRAARDALAVHHLAGALNDSVSAQGMAELYDGIENPLVRVLARMEHVGVAVDVVELRALYERLGNEVRRLGGELRALAGRDDLNLNSPTQLRQLLYDERGLSPGKKTKTGYSTDAATLEKLRDQWPEFIEPLLAHRELEKLRGTYGEGLLAEVSDDGRIHATFNQTVARTGRLSSDKPNLHNIPVRRDEGRQFRKAFIPGGGYRLLVADYNQIELRCIAHLAADPGLIAAFTGGEDIHTATAARVFSVEPLDVTLDQRSKAKMVSYGLAYGMEAYGLGQRLNIRTEDAALILAAYFEAFPNVRAYMEATVVEARKCGYTETLFGRRRPIPELMNSNPRIRQAGERQAMNAGIQGLAADIFKVALVRIDQALESERLGSRLTLQVHDEVLVEVPDAERDHVGQLVVDLMRGAAQLDVPLEVNVAWGDTWADAKS